VAVVGSDDLWLVQISVITDDTCGRKVGPRFSFWNWRWVVL